ncbi:UDPGP type 1 family protein [bacterium]|nr:UDPGP type 1 family protein [bacterium]
MIHGRTPDEKRLIQTVHDHGQEHLFRFWDSLSGKEKDALMRQIGTIDFELVAAHRRLLSGAEEADTAVHTLDPAPCIPIPRDEAGRKRERRAREIGEEAIRAGKVAAFLVAGGQGTRLGFDGPKGCFPVGPVSGKTLFQMHAEKILAASRRYGVTIPWAIMTSETNDAATREFFQEHGWFGLDPGSVIFFSQRMIPALDGEGRLILDGRDHIFMNPNGHGGSLLALYESGTIGRFEARGVEILSYFQVDNVLIRIVDPVFIGYHIQAGAGMSSKMVQKSHPGEKVGVFGIRDGKLNVIEYSDLSPEDAEARLPDGSLKYGSGSIAIHLIDTKFVRAEAEDGFRLPYHTAFKKVPYLTDSGDLVDPDTPNAFKFETFVFDALADTSSPVIMEIVREHEFSPVKNAAGEDSPATARRDLSNYYGGWLEAAGVPVPRDAAGNAAVPLEISPLFALDREEFTAKAAGRELTINGSLYLEE